jgi:hypothetical protein
VQKRNFIINYTTTPNPDSLAFTPEGVKVLPPGIPPIEFNDRSKAKASPLARMLFAQDEIKRVFLTSDFITITKDEDAEVCLLRDISCSINF